uniref:Aminoglycoside 3'-phosphotransferase n=1 Tax=Streptomyces ribosidificus TaxID=80859 RepID=KKA9_STRRI|nr:aminoglycoside O-phosphotransferase APH(3')-Vb [Streptomyces ribosidificus]P13250.1 RecName: Full=Aminoglycoside 3'-phosphotransferase; AltName: Full=APH(3'); AltName: Full=Kanamycin kinase; AltName: Full=Ribostamycin phosphotransferase [Streptomyces ribosidificus]pir/PKSMK/ kanamycin kinase (EC 2.7.1.95) - Streptomyces sp [Streptomyces sp.]AAC32025.1 aminoglycoside phosphotransferase [Streptomyces ribosidificus]
MESTLRRTYPHHTWHLVNEGDSGAFVYRLTGHGPELYAKIAPRTPENSAFHLDGEADRLDWLARHGISVPRVVERGADDTTAWLVTEAVPGAAASEEWPEDERAAVVDAIAEMARTLHELPVSECPFDRRLDVTGEARHNVREGLVDLDDLQEEPAGWTGDQLLAELDLTRPEKEDLVVCHGDLCPNNVLLDPETHRITGLIDVGRLRLATCHADLALAARELAIDEDPWFGPAYAERFLERYGAHHVDQEKMAFYQLLDEFF